MTASTETAAPGTGQQAESHTIRLATAADAERIAEIYARYVAHSYATFDEQPMSAHEWITRLATLEDTGHPALVAVAASGTVVGSAYAAPWNPKHAYRPTVETSIYLDPLATGSGLGRRLLGALIDACRAADHAEMIAVISDNGSEASLALHERLGFRRAGRLENVGCKFGTWVGVHLLQLSLR